MYRTICTRLGPGKKRGPVTDRWVTDSKHLHSPTWRHSSQTQDQCRGNQRSPWKWRDDNKRLHTFCGLPTSSTPFTLPQRRVLRDVAMQIRTALSACIRLPRRTYGEHTATKMETENKTRGQELRQPYRCTHAHALGYQIGVMATL